MAHYNIFDTLSLLGVAREEDRTIFSEGTRDRDDLIVYKDSRSGVIYIDNFYVGHDVYEKGDFRKTGVTAGIKNNYEKEMDACRRVSRYKGSYTGKNIADFGCGSGLFLQKIQGEVSASVGIELESQYIDELKHLGIKATKSLDDLEDESLDTVFAFHVLEHLPDPIHYLELMHRKLKVGGSIIIEVPHANDFLMSSLDCKAFKKFTLWSQHLVLHTRHSLARLIAFCGFSEPTIEGVQRYPLSNHLHWLSEGTPGGHKSMLSLLDSDRMTAEYESSLNRIDATDTLVAVSRKT